MDRKPEKCPPDILAAIVEGANRSVMETAVRSGRILPPIPLPPGVTRWESDTGWGYYYLPTE